MFLLEVKSKWPLRNDPVLVNVSVRREVMPLDVVPVYGLAHALHLVDLLRVVPDVRVVNDPPTVRLKVLHVHRIEAHERREQAHVGLCKLAPTKISVLR